jgi:hypothetical protein
LSFEVHVGDHLVNFIVALNRRLQGTLGGLHGRLVGRLLGASLCTLHSIALMACWDIWTGGILRWLLGACLGRLPSSGLVYLLVGRTYSRQGHPPC